MYFFDYKDLLNLFISKLNDQQLIQVLKSNLNLDFNKDYTVAASQLKIKPNEVYFFNNKFKYKGQRRHIYFSNFTRKLLYLNIRAQSFYQDL
jgi:hypothetical protein